MKVTIDGHVIEGTPEEIKEYFELLGAKFPVDAKPKEEETPQFKEGDRVKVLTEGEFGGVAVGEIGTVAEGYADDEEYNVRVDGEDDHDYFRPQDLELVTEEETPTKPTTIKRKARVGERILITKPYITGDQYKEGDQFTVVKSIEETPYEFGCVKVDGVRIRINDTEYEVIDEEKAREFKKGDIVSDGTGNAMFTVLSDHEIRNGYVNFPEMIRRNIDEVKLVAPVENRVDYKAEVHR